jgi:tRNA threonylcarbamoyladenosine biosynthesis protein TsaE
MEWQITTEDELQTVLHELLPQLPAGEQATVLALHGDLGAGKTTFVQTLARQLGVQEVVTSPTFVLMKQYETSEQFKQLIHIDAYRLEEPAELERLGLPELLALPNTLICIEWAERVAELLPAATTHLSLTLIGATRHLTTTYAER